MFDAKAETVVESRVTKYRIVSEGETLTFAMFLRSLRDLPGFREYFTELLASSPFQAFRWETPALARNSQDDPFEFVLLNSPGLARPPDPSAFRDHFISSDRDVLSFPNLGRDAQMIVPCPTGNDKCYAHLASYVRGGPADQIDRMWQLVGREAGNAVQRKPRWLSTAGGGVAWLHIRIDTKPKYYGFSEYRTLREGSQGGWFGRFKR